MTYKWTDGLFDPHALLQLYIYCEENGGHDMSSLWFTGSIEVMVL